MKRCWICERRAAEDVTRRTYDGKQLSCKNCGRYDVAGTVILELVALSPAQKAEALSKAKRFVANGEIPTISRLSFRDRGRPEMTK